MRHGHKSTIVVIADNSVAWSFIPAPNCRWMHAFFRTNCSQTLCHSYWHLKSHMVQSITQIVTMSCKDLHLKCLQNLCYTHLLLHSGITNCNHKSRQQLQVCGHMCGMHCNGQRHSSPFWETICGEEDSCTLVLVHNCWITIAIIFGTLVLGTRLYSVNINTWLMYQSIAT